MLFFRQLLLVSGLYHGWNKSVYAIDIYIWLQFMDHVQTAHFGGVVVLHPLVVFVRLRAVHHLENEQENVRGNTLR